MSNDTLPDLSAWHPVPAGATIREGTRYAKKHPDGDVSVTVADYDFTACNVGLPRYTEERIGKPLPDMQGAKIIAEVIDFELYSSHYLLTLGEHGQWRTSRGWIVSPEDIARWTLAPAEWNEGVQ